MRIIVAAFLLILAGCGKPEVINQPESAPADSASLIVVNASSPATGASIIAYNQNRQKKWEFNFTQTVDAWSKPALQGNQLSVAGMNQLHALDLSTGNVMWSFNQTPRVVNPKYYGDTIVTAASILGPSSMNKIFLLNKQSGAVIWNHTVTEQPIVAPVISSGKIYCLTTNSNGTAISLYAINLNNKTLAWSKSLATGFLMAVPPEMIIRNDTLIAGSLSGLVTVMNKNDGQVYWSKNINADKAFIVGNEIIYSNPSTYSVEKLSLQTGNVHFQSAPIPWTLNGGHAYIYDNAFYHQVHDSLFCTSLTTGQVKWRRGSPGYFRKFTRVGETVYASLMDYSLNDQSKIMIMRASDFTKKDSIVVAKQNLDNLSVLSTSGGFY